MHNLQALIAEAGEAEWSRLTERERQRRLVTLKREAKRLKCEGRNDELAALMGGLEEQSERL